jgi:phytoene/squalene synthetase
MNKSSGDLARAITCARSKQTYITARLLVDRDLAEDCLRAYAYLRWVDDVIDEESPTNEERIAFITRQRQNVERLYKGERPEDLAPHEEMVADLIEHNPQVDNGLHSFICNFLEVLEFDARRKGRLISQNELAWYSRCLGKSVTDGIQFFIGNRHVYPDTDGRYLAATAAHITHMLRDMKEDLGEGFINIPREYLEACGLDRPVSVQVIDSFWMRAWVQEQVALARACFCAGKRYLDQLDILRCKIAGYWYCARFEVVLDAIERDGYILRDEYNERRRARAWLKMARLGICLALDHTFQRLGTIRGDHRQLGPESDHCKPMEMEW